MTMAPRLPKWIATQLIVCTTLLMSAASHPAARAGFELALDSSSLRSLGDDRYTIDVDIKVNAAPEDEADVVDLHAVQATFTTDRAGLVFLSIGPAQGGIFGASDSFYPDPIDSSPSSGAAGEPWTAGVNSDDPVHPTGTQSIFELEFWVAAPGPYTISFVNDSSSGTQYFYGPGFDEGNFTQLTPATVLASTPEPSSCALLATAMGGMGLWRWRRRKSCRASAE